MRHPFYKFFFAAAIMLSLIAARPSWTLEGTEYQVKGAMMINFIKFVQWPEPADGAADGAADALRPQTITIGIAGASEFESTLDRIHGRQVGEKTIIIRRIRSLDQISACQVVYVGASAAHQSYPILRQVAGTPVLSIGEDEDFLNLGGIIRLYTEKAHVRFEINQRAARQAGLKLSAKLLEVAAVVY